MFTYNIFIYADYIDLTEFMLSIQESIEEIIILMNERLVKTIFVFLIIN